MFLTQNEFAVLSGIIIGLTDKEMQEKFHLSKTVIKQNKNALCKKYGGKEHYLELRHLADLKKVEVFETENIPYFQYENSILVQKIKINKKEVQKLYEFFRNKPENKDYELISNDDFSNLYRNIEIKDIETGEKYPISTIIDGYILTPDKEVDIERTHIMDMKQLEKDFKTFWINYNSSPKDVNTRWIDAVYVLKILNTTVEQMYENETAFAEYIKVLKEYSSEHEWSCATETALLLACCQLDSFLKIERKIK